MNDNNKIKFARENSHDSRYWVNTYVERSAIMGKAVLRYWPLNKISILK